MTIASARVHDSERTRCANLVDNWRGQARRHRDVALRQRRDGDYHAATQADVMAADFERAADELATCGTIAEYNRQRVALQSAAADA